MIRPPTGNRTTYSWTYENQLAVAALPTGSRTTQTWAPVTRSNDEYRVVQQTSATAFVKHFWDRNNIVLETNNPGTVTAEFTVIPEDYGAVVSDRRSGATGQFHYDGLGSTAGLSNASQTLANTYQYSAFGTLLSGTGTGTNPFQWVGSWGTTGTQRADLLIRSLRLPTISAVLPQSSEMSSRMTASRFVEPTAEKFVQTDPFAPLRQLAAVLPIDDLSESSRSSPLSACLASGDCTAQVSPIARDLAIRALHRSAGGHILLTGRKGVGKTTLVRQIAQFTRSGEAPQLSNTRFLWIDCKNVGPEDSRACLESIFTAVGVLLSQSASGAGAASCRLVVCLDGLGAVLKRNGGGTNKPLLRAMLNRGDLRLIGVMSSWDYNDLIGGDADMLDLFTRIEVDEPNQETALSIAQLHAKLLSEEFGLSIGDHVVERTVALCSTCILNECHPAKSITVLRRVFEDADYERSHLRRDISEVSVDDVIRALSEKTGIPAHTIAGEAEDVDFEKSLSDAVVGQPEPVRHVANELQLIKAGLTEPAKPATVMLFAGMTGVGKTELAKRIAELYSTSRRLQVYTMGNFTEPHSVSGIIGVPPGYVGHEQGGRLINELNADPYSVFLLDEAEKCHPNIWKPFLNLFDEGWIVDQRGVKAYADRAIFILTTNAGDQHVAQMTRNGASAIEVTEAVKRALAEVRHERSSQQVFPPQFLSRIRRIIVFSPLDERAMIGIAERACRRMQGKWLQKREKRIEIARELIEYIGRRAHDQNEKANGEEGGRLVNRLTSDLIELAIQIEATRHPEAYHTCHTILVDHTNSDDGLVTRVRFE